MNAVRVPENPLITFDGSCEPFNPGGVGTWGWCLWDQLGRAGEKGLVATGSGVSGEGTGTTNNVAEYHALGHGLRFLVDAGYTGSLTIKGDSKLVIYQVSGQWRCNKEHLNKLRQRCRDLISQIVIAGDDLVIKWIPREENEQADFLSQRAYEEHTGKAYPLRMKHRPTPRKP